MNKNILNYLIIIVIVLIAFGIGAAGSFEGYRFGDLPLFGLAVITAFVIQWLVFVPSYLYKTEKFFDLTGSLTYIFIAMVSVLLIPKANVRSMILAALIVIWAIRLGSFLFRRIMKAGEDKRFDEIKRSFSRFMLTWTLQGLWITFTASAALAAITSSKSTSLDWSTYLGLAIWIFGFAIEVIADQQKLKFKSDPDNTDKFIKSGLWSLSRHPNYFGEIVLWIGVSVIAFPALQGLQYVTLISPLFVALLLIRISGIPMLEARADDKWGGMEEYEEYKHTTSILIPFPPKKV